MKGLCLLYKNKGAVNGCCTTPVNVIKIQIKY